VVTAAEAVLVAWFAITVFAQGRFRFLRWTRRLSGPAGLVPGWNLFSPAPVVADVVVDARGSSPAGEHSEWMPVVHPTTRRWRDALLCVERRATKVVFDAAVAVVHLAHDDVATEVLVTRRCYLTVLHLASQTAPPDMPWVEFRIVHLTYDDGRPASRILFESRPHRRGLPRVLEAATAGKRS
jgi:hypothetical protein